MKEIEQLEPLILTENVFTAFLNKKKQPKEVRDILTTFSAMENMSLIPEKEFNRFYDKLYKIIISIKVIGVDIKDAFPKISAMETEKTRIEKKYGKELYYTFALMTNEEKENWEKIRIASDTEWYIKRNLSGINSATIIPFKIYQKLEERGLFNPIAKRASFNPKTNSIPINRIPDNVIEKYQEAIKILIQSNQYPAAKVYQENIDELNNYYFSLLKAINNLKTKVETSASKKSREKQAAIKGSVNPKILDEIKIIAEDFRKIIQENQYNFYVKRSIEFQNLVKEKGTSNFYSMFPFKNGKNYMDENASIRNNQLEKYAKILKPVKDGNELKTDSEIVKMSFDESVEEANKFLFKMSDKLGGMFKDIVVNLKIAKMSARNIRSNSLFFNINNGDSSFEIQNSIVSAYSVLRTFFYRYPTTFHNCQIKGKKLKNPDEATVKQVLNQAYES